MTAGAVRLSVEGALALITLARPQKLNALDAGMIADLHTAALAIEAQADIRVALISGEGKAFCAEGVASFREKRPPLFVNR